MFTDFLADIEIKANGVAESFISHTYFIIAINSLFIVNELSKPILIRYRRYQRKKQSKIKISAKIKPQKNFVQKYVEMTFGDEKPAKRKKQYEKEKDRYYVATPP